MPDHAAAPKSKSKIIDKIVKLFSLGGNNTSEQEMMLAVTKARELMARHQISMADVELVKGESAAQKMRWTILEYNAYTRRGTTLAQYDHAVAVAVGHMTDTRPILAHGRTFDLRETISMKFVGEQDDAALAGELFLIWLNQVRKMAYRVYGSGKNVWKKEHTSYAVGVASRLAHRAQEHVANLTPKEEQTFALVVASKADAIARHLGDTIRPAKERKRDYDHTAFARGYRDGDQFQMGTKILNETTKQSVTVVRKGQWVKYKNEWACANHVSDTTITLSGWRQMRTTDISFKDVQAVADIRPEGGVVWDVWD